MQPIMTLIVFCMVIYFIDRACLWLESKGWLYYRKNKPHGGVVGNALLELHSF